RLSFRSRLGFLRVRPILPPLQRVPNAPDVVRRRVRSTRREDRLPPRGDVGEHYALVHDADELTAPRAELVLGLTRKAGVRPCTVHDEHAPNGTAPELLSNSIRLVE